MYSSQVILSIINKIKQSEVVVKNSLVVDFNQFLDDEDSMLVYIVTPETQVRSDATSFDGSTYTLGLGLVFRVFNQSVGLEGLETMMTLDKIVDKLKKSTKELGIESLTITQGTNLASIYDNGVKDFEVQFKVSYFR